MRTRYYCLSGALALLISAVSVNLKPGLAFSASPLTSGKVAASESGAETIEYLLAHVAQSGHTFVRNGQEHDSRAAAAHLRHKYEHLKADIVTPEDFIEKVASGSLLSGRPYLVRLPGGREAPVETWLRDVLKDHRH